MSYYHILIEVNDHISTIEQTRDIELFDIIELKPYLHSILLPYFNEQEIGLKMKILNIKIFYIWKLSRHYCLSST